MAELRLAELPGKTVVHMDGIAYVFDEKETI
jgi:hypothetical protein